jgi:hypothetical protein
VTLKYGIMNHTPKNWLSFPQHFIARKSMAVAVICNDATYAILTNRAAKGKKERKKEREKEREKQ